MKLVASVNVRAGSHVGDRLRRPKEVSKFLKSGNVLGPEDISTGLSKLVHLNAQLEAINFCRNGSSLN